MIMSPFILDKNVPLIGPPRGGQIGADVDEPGRVAACGSAGACEERGTASGGRSNFAAGQLPASKAFVEAAARTSSRWAEAWQRGTEFASCLRSEIPTAGPAAGAREV